MTSKRGADTARRNKANMTGHVVRHPGGMHGPRHSSIRTLRRLAELETENTELRHQAVELALQIQKLVESQLR
jgi:hypothetical protein